MKAELLPVITGMLLAALFTVFSAVLWLLVKGSRSKVTFSFVGCVFSQLLWIISQLMIIMSESEKQFLISYAVGNLGICFLGSCWLLFAVSYMDRELSKPLVTGTLTFSTFIFLCAVTNPLHKFYYTDFSPEAVVHGPVFYIMQVYTYTVMLIGIALVCKKCFEIKERSRGQAVLLTLATAIPLTINLLTLGGIISIDLALTPISFALSGILILLATYRYGFLNVNDVAFEDAFNTIEEGVVIFNHRDRITYLSTAARRQLDISEKTDLTSLMGYISELAGKAVDKNFDYAEIKKNGTVYGIRHYHCCNDKGVSVAQLLIVSDISRYYQLIEKTDELALARQKLVLEQERNRIAQEVHDTAGHTFTIISSLAKLSKARLANIAASPEANELLEFAEKTESLARGGLTQLRCSINDLREDSFMTTVTAAVRTVTNAVRDINIQVCVQGTEDERYSFCVQNIYSSFRELITNSVRYSGADRIDVIIKFLGTWVELYVFDNGRGCSEITAHDGLRGITERTEALDGTAVFRSGEGIGFTAIIKIPVKEEQNDKGDNS
ncbi:MAG: two-component sensor histidine kinase [Oscillospiraceae bacterium]|nr:two-component sensor histidine kinase [Oscillospiraceae bacterium]